LFAILSYNRANDNTLALKVVEQEEEVETIHLKYVPQIHSVPQRQTDTILEIKDPLHFSLSHLTPLSEFLAFPKDRQTE